MNATTEVGQLRLQSVDMILPTDSLDHDIPVDREHVENLKKSLQGQGQLAPILVWVEGNQVIDGFHRLNALKELGIPEIRATVVDCTEGEFIDARVVSATMHKGVTFARIVSWIQDAWAKTKWAEKITSVDAFCAYQSKRPGNLYKPSSLVAKGLTISDVTEVVAWVTTKSDLWGLHPMTIYQMLKDARGASPTLVASVVSSKTAGRRGGALTRVVLKEITSRIPDYALQEAVVKKAIAERLNKVDAADLAGKVARTPKAEIPELLMTSWVEVSQQQLGNAPTRRVSAVSWPIESTINLLQDAQLRLEAFEEDGVGDQHPELERALIGLYSVVGRFMGEGGGVIKVLRARLSASQKRAKELKAENERLQRDLAAANRTLGMGRRIANDN